MTSRSRSPSSCAWCYAPTSALIEHCYCPILGPTCTLLYRRLGTLAACCLAEEQGLPAFPQAFLERAAARLRPLAPMIAPWEACLDWLARDKKSAPDRQNPARTAIHCILPCPRALAEQRLLPPEAWGPAHRRLLTLLT